MTAIDIPPAHAHAQPAAVDESAKVYGVVAEFDNVTDVLHAAHAAHDAGYRRMDVHSPFPIHGIDEALGVKPTILPWLVLGMGLCGMATGVVLTTYTMGAWDVPEIIPTNFEPYGYLISGKPLNSFAAYIPPIFELTIMFAAYTAVFAMFLLNKLPLLYHPLFKAKNFRRATQDRFFLAIESIDPRFDTRKTSDFLKQHHAVSVQVVNE